MTTITINMPNVSSCSVSECAYNTENRCHARAITVGDGAKANCDTFYKNSPHVSNVSVKAGVGACKVSACQFNQDLECQAESIKVGYKKSSIECLTFSAA